MNDRGRVVAVCVSPDRGMKKQPVDGIRLKAGHGIEGDAHAGPGDRQVSLLAVESIRKMRDAGLDVGSGDFAENITTEGLELVSLTPGNCLAAGTSLLEVTRIGKECHSRCAIYEQAGDCVMPREGIFARVLRDGEIWPGDELRLVAEEGDRNGKLS